LTTNPPPVLSVSARVGSGSGSGTGTTAATDPDPNADTSSDTSSDSDTTTGTGGSAYNPYNPNNPNGAGSFNPGFDIVQMMDYRRIHGILAATAMVILFPVGSVIMRVVPGKWAVWVHAGFQMLAWAVYVAAVGVGIYLVNLVGDALPGGGFVSLILFPFFCLLGVEFIGLGWVGCGRCVLTACYLSSRTRRRGITPSSASSCWWC
jgi:hypothetical protein